MTPALHFVPEAEARVWGSEIAQNNTLYRIQ